MKLLQERFEIPIEYSEFNYYKENNGAENYIWKKQTGNEVIKIISYEGEVYHYLNYNLGETSKCISKLDERSVFCEAVKNAAEIFLKRMFPKGWDKLVLNVEKIQVWQFKDYRYFKLEYEQFCGGRQIFSYGASISMRVYQDKTVITECRGGIAHITD